MASLHVPTAANDHLEHLGDLMQRKGWRVSLTITTFGPVLTVSDPDARDVAETVVCRQAADGTWHYMWGPDKTRVGSVARAGSVARRIADELRGATSRGDDAG